MTNTQLYKDSAFGGGDGAGGKLKRPLTIFVIGQPPTSQELALIHRDIAHTDAVIALYPGLEHSKVEMLQQAEKLSGMWGCSVSEAQSEIESILLQIQLKPRFNIDDIDVMLLKEDPAIQTIAFDELKPFKPGAKSWHNPVQKKHRKGAGKRRF
jgi:hypothetical protein